MTDETDREDDLAITAEYALGLLTPAEARAFEARLAVDPGFRTDYAAWCEDFARLTDAIPDETPPPAIRDRLMASLFPEEKQSFLRRLGLLPAMLGGLAAALSVIFTVGLGVLQGPSAPLYSAEIASEDGGLVVQAVYDPDAGQLAIARTAGAAPEGRVLELWLIAGDNPPASLGVLPDGAETVVDVPEGLLAGLEGGVLAISEEPPGGSPTGAPTGQVLATGEVRTL